MSGRVTVAGIGLAVLLLAGCSSGGSATDTVATSTATTIRIGIASVHQGFRGTGRPELGFVGDSITYLVAPELNRRFDATYDVAIDATIGFDTLLSAKYVTAQAARAPKVEVIDLGTNDALRLRSGVPMTETRQTLPEVEARFAQITAAFPPTTCLIFVTVNTHNPTWNPAGARAINAYLRAHAPHLVDWDAAWQASSFAAPDDPHPNTRGAAVLVDLLARTIAGCPAAGP